jgi:hypothetical protein
MSVDTPNLLKIPEDFEIESRTQPGEWSKAGEGWQPGIPNLLIPSSIMGTTKKGDIPGNYQPSLLCDQNSTMAKYRL